MTDVGKRIQECRKRAGLSQDQLAELALLNRVTIAKYESGKVEPGIQATIRIASALGMSVNQLIGGGEVTSLDPTSIDDDSWAIRERLRRDPNMRLLFSAAEKATPEHLRAAAAMLKALEPPTFPEDEPQEFPE